MDTYVHHSKHPARVLLIGTAIGAVIILVPIIFRTITGFTCIGMASVADAELAYLVGASQLDGDKDGKPCESLIK